MSGRFLFGVLRGWADGTLPPRLEAFVQKLADRDPGHRPLQDLLDDGVIATTLALGEEDDGVSTRAMGEEDGDDGDKEFATTLAIGEEDDGGWHAPRPTTLAFGEEDDDDDGMATTLAIGEEDGDDRFDGGVTAALGEEDCMPGVWATTLAIGEEDDFDFGAPTTEAVGEEDGDDDAPPVYTTLALGEEDGNWDVPLPPEAPVDATTLALGEEDGSWDAPDWFEVTSAMIGEEDTPDMTEPCDFG